MKSDIENSGLDYVALGHVHSFSEIEKAGKTHFAYSGCAVGRSFDECGYKYAIIGGISKENGVSDVRLGTFKCSDRRFEILKVDITGAKSNSQALSTICEKAEGFGEDTSLRVIIDGAVSPDISVSLDDVRKALRLPSYVELIDNTLPLFDAEKLRGDMTVVGAFYRSLEKKLESPDPKERKTAFLALKFGLAALCGRDIGAE